MNPFQLMKFHEKGFTKSDKLISKSLLETPYDFIQANISLSAEKINTSPSALLRFCKKLGYKGFSEFRFELERYLNSANHAVSDEETGNQRIISIYKESLDQFLDSVSDEKIETLAKNILNASKVKIFGVERTGLVAQELYLCLLKIGISSEVFVDEYLFSLTIKTTKSDELHIYISVSGLTTKINDSIQESYEENANVAVITHNPNISNVELINTLVILPMADISQLSFSNIQSHVLNHIFIEVLIASIKKNYKKSGE